MASENNKQARVETRKLVSESLDKGDSYSWNEQLYVRATGDMSKIPWADGNANPNLTQWLEGREVEPGIPALVIGCGLGDDAEDLSRRGYKVTAFDVSETAVAWCKKRFPDTKVDYVVADLFSAPAAWRRSFGLVVESYTLQTLPEQIRNRAMQALAQFVAPKGVLLVIARGRDLSDPKGDFPWPLLRDEFLAFGLGGLKEVFFEDYIDQEAPPVRRFRVEYRRP